MTEDDLDKLIEDLKVEDEEIRQAAADALGKIGDSRAVEPLIEVLVEEDIGLVAEAAAAAADALGKIGDSRAVEPLIGVLDIDRDVSEAAAWALGEIGDARAVEPLIKTLHEYMAFADYDGDAEVRYAVERALGKISGPGVDALIRMLDDEDGSIREGAAFELGKTGGARAVDPLIMALGDGHYRVSEAAAGALDKLGWRPDTDELRAAHSVAKRDWKECIKFGDLAIKPLTKYLRVTEDDLIWEKEDICEAATDALKKLGYKIKE